MTIYAWVLLLLLPPVLGAAWWGTYWYWPRRQPVDLRVKDMLHRDAQAMYLRLHAALPQYLIFARASLGAFLEARGESKSVTSSKQIELDQQTADFIICSSDFRVVAAVELEDVIGGRTGPGRSSLLLQAAEVPILRWTSASLPTIRDIQEAVAELETLRLLRIGMEKRPAEHRTPDSGSIPRARVNRGFKP